MKVTVVERDPGLRWRDGLVGGMSKRNADVLPKLGDVVSAQAYESNIFGSNPVEETAAILLRFENGVLATISVSDAIVAAVDRTNSGILVDALHFDRSASTIEQLDAVPRSRLPFVHLCDAPAEKPATMEAMIFTAGTERLAPGEGCIDLQRILRHMPPGITVALEVPMEKLTCERGSEEVARRAREGAARVLATIERD
jgi:sugar phosphate isomerase/epimerase